jgi:hypothetical protein
LNYGFKNKTLIKEKIMNIKRYGKLFLATVFAVALSTNQSFAGGVDGYTGNVSSVGAAISSGAGATADAAVTLDFVVPTYIALGLYDTGGANANAIFSNPAANFPNGTTFTTADNSGILLFDEGDLASKFDINGVDSNADSQTIMNAINLTADTPSQDVIIKGATFSNVDFGVTTLYLSTSVDSIILAGGQGSAPTYVFRGIVGVPGAVNTDSVAPNTTPITLNNLNTSNLYNGDPATENDGYARFSIIGDLSEASVDRTTKGAWTGSFTISLTGL